MEFTIKNTTYDGVVLNQDKQICCSVCGARELHKMIGNVSKEEYYSKTYQCICGNEIKITVKREKQ